MLCGFLGVCASGHSTLHLNLDPAAAWFTETGMASKGIQIRASFLTRNSLAVIMLMLTEKLIEENKIIKNPSSKGLLVLAFYCIYFHAHPPFLLWKFKDTQNGRENSKQLYIHYSTT